MRTRRNVQPRTNRRPRYSALSTKALQEAYGQRFEQIISADPDPESVMAELAAEAYRRELIDTPSLPRRLSPEEFVTEFWTENPAVRDRLELSRAYLPKPSNVLTLLEALEVLAGQ